MKRSVLLTSSAIIVAVSLSGCKTNYNMEHYSVNHGSGGDYRKKGEAPKIIGPSSMKDKRKNNLAKDVEPDDPVDDSVEDPVDVPTDTPEDTTDGNPPEDNGNPVDDDQDPLTDDPQ